MKLVILPEAQEELRQAAEFYIEQANVELGEAFLTEFERSALALLVSPHIGVIWRSGTRRFSLHRFPYNVIYQIKPDLLRVIAVAHQSRRPGYWVGRK